MRNRDAPPGRACDVTLSVKTVGEGAMFVVADHRQDVCYAVSRTAILVLIMKSINAAEWV